MIRREGNSLPASYIVPSPGLLDIGVRLEKAGIDVDTAIGASELMREAHARPDRRPRVVLRRPGRQGLRPAAVDPTRWWWPTTPSGRSASTPCASSSPRRSSARCASSSRAGAPSSPPGLARPKASAGRSSSSHASSSSRRSSSKSTSSGSRHVARQEQAPLEALTGPRRSVRPGRVDLELAGREGIEGGVEVGHQVVADRSVAGVVPQVVRTGGGRRRRCRARPRCRRTARRSAS